MATQEVAQSVPDLSLADLMWRCEYAHGGDEALDEQIACTLGIAPTGFAQGGGKHWMRYPAFTSSISAALSLVPEGLRVRLGQYSGTSPLWEAVVSAPHNEWWTMPLPMASPSLALCRAALAARERISPTDTGREGCTGEAV